jgi:lysophospholipase L1-like esterase
MPEWDYVALGDSITMGMAPRYAEMLEQDLGVTITLHERQVSYLSSEDLLKMLRTDEQLRQELQEAEVITFNISFRIIGNAMTKYTYGEPGECGGVDNQDCIREAFSRIMANTDDIFAEIVSLCRPSETLIRTIDTWHIKVTEEKDLGIFDTTNKYWREVNAHVIEVATSYGIPVARLYDAFMGKDGIEDPRDLGLVQFDGIHPTSDGVDLMTSLLQDLGYEYAPATP